MHQSSAPDVIRSLLWANLIAGFVLYVTYYHELEGALAIIRNVTPPLILIFGMMLAFSKDRSIIRRKRSLNEEYEVITITYWDALVIDVITFLTPAVILATATIFSPNGITFLDLFQAAISLVALAFVRNYIFRKVGR